jgi:hypothetical protein
MQESKIGIGTDHTNKSKLLTLIIICTCVAFSTLACTPQAPLPTAAILPTANIVVEVKSTVPSNSSDSSDNGPTVWGEHSFGSDKVAMTFFARDGAHCVSLKTDSKLSVERCASSGTLVVAQFSGADKAGKTFTAIGGQALNSKIIVVSIELDRGESTPVDTQNGGFLTVLEGQRKAIAVVPIDNLGNLVGQRYLMR